MRRTKKKEKGPSGNMLFTAEGLFRRKYVSGKGKEAKDDYLRLVYFLGIIGHRRKELRLSLKGLELENSFQIGKRRGCKGPLLIYACGNEAGGMVEECTHSPIEKRTPLGYFPGEHVGRGKVNP